MNHVQGDSPRAVAEAPRSSPFPKGRRSGGCGFFLAATACLWIVGIRSLLVAPHRDAERLVPSREGFGGRSGEANVAEAGSGESTYDGATRATLELHLDPPLSIGLRLYRDEAPDAHRFLREVAASADGCADCRLYRTEPVPDFWGDESLPDSYFGGRCGPPFALVQGQFSGGEGGSGRLGNPRVRNAVAEDHRPVVRRGHVAWAGGKGGPHFFVALADHPEWKTSQTVWAEVLEEDMAKIDALVEGRELKKITPERPPILSYFVEPISFTVSMPK